MAMQRSPVWMRAVATVFGWQRWMNNDCFLGWDATSDLAQATWEWPKRQRAGTAFAAVADREARLWGLDWERRGKKEFSRQLYGP